MESTIVVTNAGFNAANGTYQYIDENIYEMKSNNTRFCITFDSNNPYGTSIVLTQNENNESPIILYLNPNVTTMNDLSNNTNTQHWIAMCGREPVPICDKHDPKVSKDNEIMNNKFAEYFVNELAIKQEIWNSKKKNIQMLYWSRKFNDWQIGTIVDSKNVDKGYICVENDLNATFDASTTNNDDNKHEEMNDDVTIGLDENNNNNNDLKERLFIGIDSSLIRPFVEVQEECSKRKLNGKQVVYVWSRKELKWLNGVVQQCAQGFVYVQCKEPRWIQENSCLIVSA